MLTCVNVVLCLLRAGVGQDAVVGVWPACGGPFGDTPPDNPPELKGSGFNFLKAPSENN